MKLATFVIKPDAVNDEDLSYIYDTIQKGGLKIEAAYRIENYVKIMKSYRFSDIYTKESENKFAELKGCSIALLSYAMLYPNGSGQLLLLSGEEKGLTDDQLFEKVNEIKYKIRDDLKEKRQEVVILYTDDKHNRSIIKIKPSEYEDFKKEHKKNAKKAFINGVHIEDKECFDHDFCLNFMKEKNIICDKNKLDIKVQKEKFVEREIK